MTTYKENNEWNFIREKLKNYEKKNSDELWGKIENKLDASPKTFFARNSYSIIAGIAAVAVALCILFVKQNNTNDIAQTTPVDNNSYITKVEKNENIIEQIQPKNENNNIVSSSNKDNKYQNNTIEEIEATPNNTNPVTENNQTNTASIKNKKIAVSEIIEQKPKMEIVPSENINIEKSTENVTEERNIKNTDNTSENSEVEISISNNQSVCLGEEIILFASGGISYQWSNGSVSENIYVTPKKSQTYTCIITTSDGNEIEKSVTVTVNDCQRIVMPNAFTPNGDGQNDVYKVEGNQVDNFYMRIISRTGQTVFTSRNINLGWDGYYEGKLAPAGTYIYVISYVDMTGNAQTLKGTVVLIR